jgi:hypothetical protein
MADTSFLLTQVRHGLFARRSFLSDYVLVKPQTPRLPIDMVVEGVE